VSSLERQAGSDWPTVLVPARGSLPPSIPANPERVLHVALRDALDKQPGLARALASAASSYAEVDWCEVERRDGTGAVGPAIIQAARDHRPTLVFMQIQRPGVLSGEIVRAIRLECKADCVVVQWDGDQHHEPDAPERRWFTGLGAECDASLIANTRYPARYAALGIRHPGFLACGYDEQVYRPREPVYGVPPLVFLANNYPHLAGYDGRRTAVSVLAQRYQERFAVYGGGWSEPEGRPWLPQGDESPVYATARGALSMSIRNDLDRCTSGRRFRALGCGTCVLVERFPDTEGLGLRDGVNCLVWSTLDEVLAHCERVLVEEMTPVRGAAAEMARALHCWPARMQELSAVIRAVREARRL
jgi:hypothetical protein